jgi:hypothetical protein
LEVDKKRLVLQDAIRPANPVDSGSGDYAFAVKARIADKNES